MSTLSANHSSTTEARESCLIAGLANAGWLMKNRDDLLLLPFRDPVRRMIARIWLDLVDEAGEANPAELVDAIKSEPGFDPVHVEREWTEVLSYGGVRDDQADQALEQLIAPVLEEELAAQVQTALRDTSTTLAERAAEIAKIASEFSIKIGTPDQDDLDHSKDDEYIPFPVGTLPHPIAEFIVTAAESMQVAPAFIALPLLAAAAGAIGNTRVIQLKPGWDEPSILWTAVIAESGSLKSPAQDIAVRPVKNRQREAFAQHEERQQLYDIDAEDYDQALVSWKKSGRMGTPPVEPVPPVMERVYVGDCTVEALATRLEDAPRGLHAIHDELSGWIASFGQYKNGAGSDVAHWLSIHGGRDLLIDRKTGDRPLVHVPRATVSLCGTIQPATLADNLGTDLVENGMAARLLMAMPPRKQKSWTDSSITDSDTAVLDDIFHDLYSLEPRRDDDGQFFPHRVTLSQGAAEAWIQFYDEHAAEQIELDGALAASSSKLEGGAARLALVVFELKQACGAFGPQEPAELDAESMNAGIALSRWFGNEARRVYSALSESRHERSQRRIEEWILRRGKPVTARDVMRSQPSVKSADQANEILQTLVGAGRGDWTIAPPKKQGGRPSRSFHHRDLPEGSIQ